MDAYDEMQAALRGDEPADAPSDLTDLLDCPFCGAPAMLHHIEEYNAWYIECTSCSVRTGDYTGPNLPREEWNARVQSN